MTDVTPQPSQSIPAGWYPDPSSPGRQRWWDGTQWTEQVSQPYTGAEPQTAPEGMDANTPWIWLYIFLPLLALLPLFFLDFRQFTEDLLANPTDTQAQLQAQLDFMFSPALIITQVLSWLIIAVTIVFAFLDYRTLKQRGMPQPFHWAFAFLSLAGFGVVYSIGRGVVTKRRTGKGYGIVLAAILSIVLIFVVAIIWTVVIVSQMLSIIATTPGLN